MPYLSDAERRAALEPTEIPKTTGELNFAVSRLMARYVEEKGVSYGSISEALSGCHEAEEEFRRRILIPYEETKIESNGDVF